MSEAEGVDQMRRMIEDALSSALSGNLSRVEINDVKAACVRAFQITSGLTPIVVEASYDDETRVVVMKLGFSPGTIVSFPIDRMKDDGAPK